MPSGETSGTRRRRTQRPTWTARGEAVVRVHERLREHPRLLTVRLNTGRGIVLALAARGCHVAINYFRHRTEAEQTAADAAQFGVKAIVVKAHVGREEEIQALVRESATVLAVSSTPLTLPTNYSG